MASSCQRILEDIKDSSRKFKESWRKKNKDSIDFLNDFDDLKRKVGDFTFRIFEDFEVFLAVFLKIIWSFLKKK